ncbi:hypothetical protein BX600DRAFT_512247 [Xylariales sp. PMI_506]|nr:hypothetical protein BX600DRAFT_512247 [Xylariales sp. PMI_506]
MLSMPSSIIIISFLSALSLALQVSPNSTCAALCLDNPANGNPLDPAASTTNSSDITCVDSDYSTTSTGIKFKNCIDCLQDSTDVSGEENDIHWFLYNVRYAVDVCLFSFPRAVINISSPCDINYACGPLAKALEAGNLSADNDTEFGYCTAGNGAFANSTIEACTQCLQDSSEQMYLSNFLIALQAGCQQQPQPGDLLGLSGSVFTDSTITITTPPTETPKATDAQSPITTGAIVGIAIGAALLFLGGSALFIVYHRKQKKLYDHDVNSGYDSRGGSKSISPPIQGGFNASEGKQAYTLSDYELRAQQQYSNAEYYDKIEEEIMTRRPNYTFDPNNPGSGPQGALPTHPAYIPRAMSRNSNRSTTPQPTPPVKSNKPDSYALQTYLAAAEEAAALKLPPPPPLGAPGGPKSVSREPSPSGQDFVLSAPPPRKDSLKGSTRANNPPPPPPPAHRKVPSLNLPSVPRIRIPKKYSPPTIQVEQATPVNEYQGRGDAADLQISDPIARVADSRFSESPYGGRANRNPSPDSRADAPLIKNSAPPAQQIVYDRRRGPAYTEVEIHTGKSSMYG